MKSFLSLFLLLILTGEAFAVGTSPTDLIQTPTARFNDAGEVWAGAFSVDSIKGVYGGYQWGDRVQINAYKYKQDKTTFVDDFWGDKYKNSTDLKFLLIKEGEFSPQIALGINSINGNSFLESEYLAFSRKFYDFDFHTGIGWGALGEGGEIDNPLSFLGSHFDEKDRTTRKRSENLFIGDKVALFGGVSYQATDNLKLKLEYNSKDYANLYHSKRSDTPISVAADYDIKDFTISAGLENGNKLMAKLNYSYDTNKLKYSYTDKVKKVRKERNKTTSLSALRLVNKANAQNINSYGATVNTNSTDLWVEFQEQDSARQNMIDASRLIYNNTSNKIKWLGVVQTKNGLTGVKSSILRTDLENLDTANGSMENLIQKAIFTTAYKESPENSYTNFLNKYTYIKPVIDLDISQQDSSLIHRLSLIAGVRTANSTFNNWNYGLAGRLNIANNIKKEWILAEGRGMEKQFSDNVFFIENLYARRTYRPWEDIYIDLQMGYLEEMYNGVSVETIYKDLFKKWGVGFNYNLHYKRKDYAMLGFYPSSQESGAISLYYEPDCLENTVLKLSLNKYLMGDNGTSLSAEKKFNNGVKLKLFADYSEYSEENLTLTESFRVNTGIKLSFPIGYGSKHNYIETNIAPLGLITGTTLRKPENLYDDLRDVSYNNLIKFKK